MNRMGRLLLLLVAIFHTQRSRSAISRKCIEKNLKCWLQGFRYIFCNYTLPAGYSSATVATVFYYPRYEEASIKPVYNGTDRHVKFEMVPLMDTLTFQLQLMESTRNVTSLSYCFKYNPDDALIPGKIQGLRVENVTASSLVLSWQPPNDGEKYSFRVTSTVSWEEKQVVQTDSFGLTLVGLVPGTNYTIQVERRAYKHMDTSLIGYWSDSEVIWVQTENDVPGTAPRIAPAITRPTGTEIILYWQPLSTRDSHGPLTAYKIKWGNNEMKQWEARVGASETSLVMNVPISPNPVHVDVCAVNEKGESPTSTLAVTPPSSEPRTPTYWVTGDAYSHNITYHWDQMDVTGGTCILFWCKRSLKDVTCQGPIEWTSTTCDQRRSRVQIRRYRVHQLMVGLSVVLTTTAGTVRSRIKWQRCIYSQRRQVPPAPEGFRLSLRQPPSGARLEWRLPDCSTSPYISHFVLYYCSIPVDSRHCTDAMRNISVSNQATSHVVQGLHPGTHYKFTLRGVSEGIMSPYSSPVTHLVQAEFNPLILIGLVSTVTVLISISLTVFLLCALKRSCREIPINTPKMPNDDPGDLDEIPNPPLPPRAELPPQYKGSSETSGNRSESEYIKMTVQNPDYTTSDAETVHEGETSHLIHCDTERQPLNKTLEGETDSSDEDDAGQTASYDCKSPTQDNGFGEKSDVSETSPHQNELEYIQIAENETDKVHNPDYTTSVEFDTAAKLTIVYLHCERGDQVLAGPSLHSSE